MNSSKPRYKRLDGVDGVVIVLRRDQDTRARLAVRRDQIDACRYETDTVPEATEDSPEAALMKLAAAVAQATGSDTISHKGTLLDLEAAEKGLAIPINGRPSRAGHLLSIEFAKLGLGIKGQDDGEDDK